MRFKDTEYGDLTNKEYNDSIILKNIKMTSLKGCPKIIKGSFSCSYNILTTLEYCPSIIKDNFYCHNNKLKTLKGRPKEINGKFDCDNNLITTLKYAPKLIGSNFYCKNNPYLKNVKEQIIKYQIKAKYYYTDEGDFKFEEIKEKFEKFGNYLSKKENQKQQIMKKNKEIDFGLSI